MLIKKKIDKFSELKTQIEQVTNLPMQERFFQQNTGNISKPATTYVTPGTKTDKANTKALVFNKYRDNLKKLVDKLKKEIFKDINESYFDLLNTDYELDENKQYEVKDIIEILKDNIEKNKESDDETFKLLHDNDNFKEVEISIYELLTDKYSLENLTETFNSKLKKYLTEAQDELQKNEGKKLYLFNPRLVETECSNIEPFKIELPMDNNAINDNDYKKNLKILIEKIKEKLSNLPKLTNKKTCIGELTNLHIDEFEYDDKYKPQIDPETEIDFLFGKI